VRSYKKNRDKMKYYIIAGEERGEKELKSK
jgi:hypothetical protein